jgi:hypothetical protein
LCDHRLRRQLAVAEDAGNLVVIGDLGCIHRLQVANRPDLLADPIFDICNVEAVGLGCCALGHCIAVQSGHFQGEAQVFLHLLRHFIEVRHPGAELAQGHILDLLCPDHRRGKRGGPEGSGAALEDRTTAVSHLAHGQSPSLVR